MQPQHLELSVVRVLELVDQDVRVARAQARERVLPLAQQRERPSDLVAEVHEPGLAEQALVRLVEGRELEVGRGEVALLLRRRPREAGLGPLAVLPRRDVLVLGAAHERRERLEMPRRVAERTEAVERQPEQPLAQEDHLLGLREHAELRIEADLERPLPQDRVAERVEGRDLRLGVAPRDQLVDALRHLRRGLLGERERQDLFRLRPLRGDEVRDPAREHRGLARPGAGDDQERPFAVKHRLALGRIQALENPLLGGHERRGSACHSAHLISGPRTTGSGPRLRANGGAAPPRRRRRGRASPPCGRAPRRAARADRRRVRTPRRDSASWRA